MPTPIRWQVPIELSPEETRVAAVLHRTGKFYVFLRKVRAELFDDAFQAELAAVYQPRGTAPLPGALLAMVPCSRPTPRLAMRPRSSPRRSIDAGSWYWAVWGRPKRRSPKARW